MSAHRGTPPRAAGSSDSHLSPPQQCRTDRRREQVREAELNGIDEVDASDDGTVLTVTFLGKAPRELGPENIRIDGGRRITDIHAVGVRLDIEEDPWLDDHMYVTVDRAGDASTYTLAVVEADAHGRPSNTPYRGFDPRYARADFSFHLACPTHLDCAQTAPCPPTVHPQPVIDYTARDYASLRRLLLDRMTLTVPDWVERHVPDLGVTVVELLAYVGDQLSYLQDAVATEAYLDTARRRVSVRRHVRLIDYAMHDGCNARTWLTLETSRQITLERGKFRFAAVDVSQVDPKQRPEVSTVVFDDELSALPAGATHEVFEPVVPAPLTLHPEHNLIRFWTWGAEECALPAGATGATLRDEWVNGDEPVNGDEDDFGGRRLRLAPGDVLIIEEVLGPRTGSPADTDPRHRQAVRLTSVNPGADSLYDQPIVDVTWDHEDALTFPVCLSSRGGPDCALLTDVSVARGNVVLVDHGRDITFCGGAREPIPVPPVAVPAPSCQPPSLGCPDRTESDPATEMIHRLLAAAKAGQPLRVQDIAQLYPHVGQDAVDRARLRAQDTATEQAAALEALLAQVTYPPVRRPFRPVLRYAPITQHVAFPEPARVAAGQARLLAGLPVRARAWLDELWRHARSGHPPSAEQVGELTVLFGSTVLHRLRLAEHPARALRELAVRFDRLLAGKLHRLESLLARAAGGEVLGPGIGWEIGQSWGAAYTEGLYPDDARLAGPASSALAQNPRAALPAVTVCEFAGEELVASWLPRRDLLGSGPRDRHVVGEVDDDGRLALRFGDGRHGSPPSPGGQLEVRYRIGNGAAGNLGAEAITHLVLCRGHAGDGVIRVRNPLPASGGTDPEPVEEVRQVAPLALRRTRLRAVTPVDYAELASAVRGVRRAAAQLRWTGSGEEVQVAVDALDQGAAEGALIDAVAVALEPYRKIGHAVVVIPAVLVPLDIELAVCVAPGYQRDQVYGALRRVLGTRMLPDGRRGFFHHDELTFGGPVRASRISAAASAVPGVASVRVTRLRRQFSASASGLAHGVLELGPLEIAQLDNDPDEPENGRLSIVRASGGGDRSTTPV